MVTMWLYTTILVGYTIKSGLTLTAAAADRQCAVTSMVYYYMSNISARGGHLVKYFRMKELSSILRLAQRWIRQAEI